MIGVIAKASEISAAEEFFQLFKTPWEFYVSQRRYDAVISTTGELPSAAEAGLRVIYAARTAGCDAKFGWDAQPATHGGWLEFQENQFPIYGDLATLKGAGDAVLWGRGKSDVFGLGIQRSEDGEGAVVRIGYDLFHEVEILLSQGQPAANAVIPTLELHIALLRSLLVNAGVSFAEVLPTPAGYDFMACLTHDVDFVGIRDHKFDSTMAGFIYRGLIGSAVDVLKGHSTWSKCRTNWRAVFSLPLVHAGIKEDFWLEFDRYMEIEKGLGSTFFFIPFKDTPGTRGSEPAPKRRGARYDLAAIKETVRALAQNGCEVGLHGIDAWQSAESAERESARITGITGQARIGVRMHWLYFSEESPAALEEAGLQYDSTFGYNDAVGFRAGTAQAFCVAPGRKLLELPLSIQDSALFYPDRMGLSEEKAIEACRRVLRQAAAFGGAVTVNWHTRSLSPERLWGDFYARLLEEMRRFRVWFGTAQQAVDWFRTRRALRLVEERTEDGLQLKITGAKAEQQPSFVVRVHRPEPTRDGHTNSKISTPAYSDIPWKGERELVLA